jgi:poly(3-hydroxybutyrate) depolymerase
MIRLGPKTSSHQRLCQAAAWLFFVLLLPAAQGAETPTATTIPLPTECLALPPVGRYGRAPIPVDGLQEAILKNGWTAPKAGDKVALADGKASTWETIQAAKDGSFSHAALRGGYAYLPVQSNEEQVALLQASGHFMVYVNGEPRAGDIYQHGYLELPILLHKGTNDLLFHCARGQLQAKLAKPRATAQIFGGDYTLPDLVVGEETDTEAAGIVVNASNGHRSDLAIEAAVAGAPPERAPVPPLLPLGARKVGFRLRGPAPKAEGTADVELKLLARSGNGDWQTLDTAKIGLRIRKPEQTQKRTFRSDIDGSVQYYAVVPPSKKGDGKPGLVLTLHGASVEAIGQADAYAPLPDLYLVAPTNRRPYGFDWEDWGRLDALEVLALAQKRFDTDPRRTYLTGHSMGGHGVWHLGATYPDRFAAIGPSAGWISMWSYAGASRPDQPTTLQELFLRSSAASDTLALSRNYLQEGVFILHGEKDDNVPAEQARTMKKHLEAFHHDLKYHEEPGVGHWWGKDGIAGAACVTWPPMFDFFTSHTIPANAEVRHVEFVTASPAVSAWSHWVGIEAQRQEMKPSSVDLQYDPDMRRFSGTTNNVSRLALDLAHLKPGAALHVELDGQKIADIAWPEGKRLWLQREGDSWAAVPRPAPTLKGPRRYGPFKDAFRNRTLFVYGTTGTTAENAWALAKARYDAETFWYRGNASMDVIADTAFDAAAERDRNVILYGNADTNAAWKALLAESPVQVKRGLIRIDRREEKDDNLGCLFVRPRPGSEQALIGVVTGSGVAGMRLTDRLPYFVSGVGYPDCVVLGPESLTDGVAGARAAGFFGMDWTVGSGEFVWSKEPR